MKVIQINLHHCKAASALLSKKLASENIDIALIQEPWVYRGFVRGVNCTGGTLYCPNTDNPRTCIYVRDWMNALLKVEFCSRDVTTIETSIREGGRKRILQFSSAYLPYDEPNPPSETVRRLVSHCNETGKELIIGTDANAHHVLWGSSDINPRGEQLLEYLVYSK